MGDLIWAKAKRAVRMAVLYERDGGICQLCGQKVDLQGSNAATVDHIIPRSVGGSDDWDNIQLAHQRCNSRKNTMDDADYKQRAKEGVERAHQGLVEIESMARYYSGPYGEAILADRQRKVDILLGNRNKRTPVTSVPLGLRVEKGDAARLKAIAASVGALAESGPDGIKGHPSISALLKGIASGALVVTRREQ